MSQADLLPARIAGESSAEAEGTASVVTMLYTKRSDHFRPDNIAHLQSVPQVDIDILQLYNVFETFSYEHK